MYFVFHKIGSGLIYYLLYAPQNGDLTHPLSSLCSATIRIHYVLNVPQNGEWASPLCTLRSPKEGLATSTMCFMIHKIGSGLIHFLLYVPQNRDRTLHYVLCVPQNWDWKHPMCTLCSTKKGLDTLTVHFMFHKIGSGLINY